MAWLYKQRDSKNWWIGYRVGGKQFLRSTETADREEAEKILATYNVMSEANRAGRLTEEFFRVLTGRTLPNVTLAAAFAEWLKECERTTSPATVTRYKGLITRFETFTDATDTAPLLRDITTHQVRAFLNKRAEKVSTSTINLERKILSVFFLRAIKQGELAVNPVLPVRKFKAARGEHGSRRAFTIKELKLIYGKAPDDFWRWMILAGFYCGQRMGDLITVVVGAFDFKENVIRLTPAKTADSSGRTLTIPMAKPVRALVTGLRKRWPKKPSAFIWPKQAELYLKSGSAPFSNEFYDEVLTPAGLVVARADKQGHKDGRGVRRKSSPVSFHSLRHTFVTLLKATGGNQAVAKELAGHSSDAVSDVYTHMPAETLNAAIAALPEVTGE